jgi:hypothetical protein
MRLDHINIKAPRDLLDREMLFLCDLLGLEDGPRPDFGAFGYWLYADGEALVHLSERAEVLEDDSQGCFDHVAFSSSGLTELIEKLDNRGIEYKLAYLGDRDLTQVFFRSPSNLRIEVSFNGEKLD